MHGLKNNIIEMAQTDVPKQYSKARGISKRFEKNPESYLTFLDFPGVDFHNNNLRKHHFAP
jgi:hypothetical protein